MIRCLTVTPDDAVATGVLTHSSPGFRLSVGDLVVAEAVDRGTPVGGVGVDLLRFSFAGAIYPTDSSLRCWAPVLAPV